MLQANLLEQSSQSEALLAQLQVQPMQPGDLLAEVVPYWHSLAEPTREAALSFLVAQWHALQSHESLTQLLKQLRFVPASSPGAVSSVLAMWFMQQAIQGSAVHPAVAFQIR